MAPIILRVKDTPIRLTVNPNTIRLKIEPAKLVFMGGPPYEGAHTVIPSLVEQILQTAGKTVTQNIDVQPIPYAEVSNDFGGKTVTIGG